MRYKTTLFILIISLSALTVLNISLGLKDTSAYNYFAASVAALGMSTLVYVRIKLDCS